jgi:hypothetical protein
MRIHHEALDPVRQEVIKRVSDERSVDDRDKRLGPVRRQCFEARTKTGSQDKGGAKH